MAVTQIGICNDALIRVGADRISSITQDTKSARLLNAVWDQAVRTVLGAGRWHFALKRTTLSPTSDEPEWGYDYEYDLPEDYVGLMETDPDDIDYVIENGKIRTDEDELDVRYVYLNDSPDQWSAGFANALSCYLAWQIAYGLTQSLPLRESMEKAYKQALNEGRTMGAMESPVVGIEADTWTDARR